MDSKGLSVSCSPLDQIEHRFIRSSSRSVIRRSSSPRAYSSPGEVDPVSEYLGYILQPQSNNQLIQSQQQFQS
uniref:Uncharacterized protein n=1 Tax=Picea glauca TaxID=3330 RepID=A0A101M0S3_PICGL|nr:hypothetical protein ABT39_MTgene4129 [Picea glauca]